MTRTFLNCKNYVKSCKMVRLCGIIFITEKNKTYRKRSEFNGADESKASGVQEKMSEVLAYH